MKNFEYTRCWSMDETEKVKGKLYQLLLDYPYSFPYINTELDIRIIPSFNVLNELLKDEGSDCGMSPGCIWESFEITKVEYNVLIERLLNLDFEEIKEAHPYAPKKLIIDKELNNKFENPREWEKQHRLKYLGVHEFIQFYDDDKPTLFLEEKEIGDIEILTTAGGAKYFGELTFFKEKLNFQNFIKVDIQKNSFISKMIEYRDLENKKWFKPNDTLAFYITDSWNRKPKVLDIYISENDYIVFRAEFEEIKPAIKIAD